MDLQNNFPDSVLKQIEKLKQTAPDYVESYIAAVRKSLSKDTDPDAKLWQRSNGTYIKISEMNQYHLSAAMNKLHNFASDMVKENECSYLDVMPAVYYDLKEEMEDRGMSVPLPPEEPT